MTPENRKRLIDLVGLTGDDLKGMLPPTEEIPNRNAYAHIWREIKQKYGASYKDLDDSLYDDIVIFISEIRFKVVSDYYSRKFLCRIKNPLTMHMQNIVWNQKTSRTFHTMLRLFFGIITILNRVGMLMTTLRRQKLKQLRIMHFRTKKRGKR